MHKVPGEYIYDGEVFCSLFPKEILDRIKKTTFFPDDVFVATYPKCGE